MEQSIMSQNTTLSPLTEYPSLSTYFTASYDSLAWGIARVGAHLVWQGYGITGEDVICALLDSGTEPLHPALLGAYWTNTGEIPANGIDDDENGYIDDIHGYDFVNERGTVYDDRGHGTHVAGTIAGRITDGFAIGVAPSASLMTLKTINDAGSGIVSNSWRAMEYAVMMNARVTNLSIGWRYSETLDRAGWRSIIDNARLMGVLPVIAAGNEGGSPDSITDLRCPGDVPSAFTVGATQESNVISAMSSVGPVSWQSISPYFDHPFPPGLTKPDIVAPGVSIPSSRLAGSFMEKTGTSMACPHISGICALIISAQPSLSPDSVQRLIELHSVDGGITGWDNYYGHGRASSHALLTPLRRYLRLHPY
jgi:subtilisin family serine protease